MSSSSTTSRELLSQFSTCSGWRWFEVGETIEDLSLEAVLTYELSPYEMNPTEWGWKQENDQLIAIMTESNAAPEELLKIIHCNCSRGCKSSRCGCRRYGLPCTAACGPCQTENCDNPNNTQQLKMSSQRRRMMILKTECYETFPFFIGVCTYFPNDLTAQWYH